MCMPLPRRCPLKTSPHNQRKFPQKWGISIFRNMPIGLIERRKGGLGNLSVTRCPKSRIGGRVVCVMGEVNTKTLPIYSALHLILTRRLLWRVTITGWNWEEESRQREGSAVASGARGKPRAGRITPALSNLKIREQHFVRERNKLRRLVLFLGPGSLQTDIDLFHLKSFR